jgi:hypothetical protein
VQGAIKGMVYEDRVAFADAADITASVRFGVFSEASNFFVSTKKGS